MSWTGVAAAAAIMIPITPAASNPDALRSWAAEASEFAEAPQSLEISLLTYNVKGVPWPVAAGRAAALRAIGEELARMRREGRQPDVVLIQEGFRAEVADLVAASGYRHWAQGPTRSERASGPRVKGKRAWRSVRYPLYGEGWGKFTGSGLHVLSDLPIVAVESSAFRHCAGLDCLANKGVMLVRLILGGGAVQVDVANTHLNTKRKAGVPKARAHLAHRLQTDEFLAFLAERRAGGRPLLIGGDFNVKNAPERYNYRAMTRPYRVVSEFCSAAFAGCGGEAPGADAAPWLRSQDLQAFESSWSAEVRPVRVDTVLRRDQGGRALSDHDGYLVRYKISFRPRRGEGALVVARRGG